MTKAAYKTTGMTIKKLTACLALFGMFLVCNGLLYPSVWDTDISKKSPDHAITEQIVTTYANKPVISAKYAETTTPATENHPTAAGTTAENHPTTANSSVSGTDTGKNFPVATHSKSHSDVSTERTFAENPASAEVTTPNAQGTASGTNSNVDSRAGVNAPYPTGANTTSPTGVNAASPTGTNANSRKAPNINTETPSVPPAPPREFVSKQQLPFPFNLFCPRSSRSDASKQSLPPANTLMRNHEADEEIVYIDLPSMDTDTTAETRIADSDRDRSSREPLKNTAPTTVAGTLPPLSDNVEPQETTPAPQFGSNADSVVQADTPSEAPNTATAPATTPNMNMNEVPSLAFMLQNRTVPATQASLQEMNRLDKAGQEHDAIIQDLDGIKHKVLNDSKAVIAEMSEQPSPKSVSEELDLNKLKEQSEKPETTMPDTAPKADTTAGAPQDSQSEGLELLPDLELDAETAPTEKAIGSTAGTSKTPPAKSANATEAGDAEPVDFPEAFGLEELEEAPVNPHFGLREPVKVNAQKPATPAPATTASPPAAVTAPTAKQSAIPALPSTNVNCGLEELPDEEEPTTPSTVEKARGPSLKELPGGLEELQEEPEDFPPVG